MTELPPPRPNVNKVFKRLSEGVARPEPEKAAEGPLRAAETTPMRYCIDRYNELWGFWKILDPRGGPGMDQWVCLTDRAITAYWVRPERGPFTELVPGPEIDWRNP